MRLQQETSIREFNVSFYCFRMKSSKGDFGKHFCHRCMQPLCISVRKIEAPRPSKLNVFLRQTLNLWD